MHLPIFLRIIGCPCRLRARLLLLLSYNQAPMKTSQPCLFSPLYLSVCQRPYLSLSAAVSLFLSSRTPSSLYCPNFRLIRSKLCGTAGCGSAGPVSSMPLARFGRGSCKKTSVIGQITESATREKQEPKASVSGGCSRLHAAVKRGGEHHLTGSIVGLLCKHFERISNSVSFLAMFFQAACTQVRRRYRIVSFKRFCM